MISKLALAIVLGTSLLGANAFAQTTKPNPCSFKKPCPPVTPPCTVKEPCDPPPVCEKPCEVICNEKRPCLPIRW